jgi:transcriptional regulator with XRE-family HTH domain
MAIYNYQELQNKIEEINTQELYKRICKNIKKIRKAKYKEFKDNYKLNSINPYTTENIASLLNYNHNHYKRFESDNDSTKRIPLEKLIMLSLIFDITLDDLIK